MSQELTSLRARHRAQTQDALLRAFVEILEEGGAYDVPLATIADRAGVSLRTAYRYFGERDALMQAVAHHINVEIFPWIPVSRMEDLPDVFAQLVEQFEAHPRLAMVIYDARRSGHIRESVRAHRATVLRELIDSSYPHVPEDVRARSHSALIALDHVASWVTLREDLALGPADISAGVGAAMRVVIDDLARQNKAPMNGSSS